MNIKHYSTSDMIITKIVYYFFPERTLFLKRVLYKRFKSKFKAHLKILKDNNPKNKD